jgi:hypothetical protein
MSMQPCTARLQIRSEDVHLTVQTVTGELVLRAQLPLWPAHPRAMLELLEAISRYCGHPLDAVLSAAASSAPSYERSLWSDDIAWGPSATVRVVFCGPSSRQLSLAARNVFGGRAS